MLEFKTQFKELFTTPVWQTQITGIDNNQIKEYCLGLSDLNLLPTPAEGNIATNGCINLLLMI